MIIHTLIHNSKAYDYAVLLNLCIGCSNIASHVYSRWLSQFNWHPMTVQWVVKCITAILGSYVIPLKLIFSHSILFSLLTILPCIAIGLLCVQFELLISRYYSRMKSMSLLKSNQSVCLIDVNNSVCGLSTRAIKNKVNLKKVQEHHAKLQLELKSYHLRDVICVAITEEIIYRGLLWKLSFILPSDLLALVFCFISVLLFSVSHITLGGGQFLSKLILGSFCMVAVILTHTVLSAIVIHVAFNMLAHAELLRSQPHEVIYDNNR